MAAGYICMHLAYYNVLCARHAWHACRHMFVDYLDLQQLFGPWVDPKVVMPKGTVASFLSLTMLYLELNDCYRQTDRQNFDISNHSASLHSCANEQ